MPGCKARGCGHGGRDRWSVQCHHCVHPAVKGGVGAAAGDAVMRKLWILFVLLLSIVPVYAADIPEELTDAIPDSAREYFENTDKANDFTSLNSGLSALWDRTCKLLVTTVQESLGGVILILSAILLCSMAEDCFGAAGGGKILDPVPLVGTLVILLAVGSNMKNLMGLGEETIEELNIFSKALLPTLSAATAASGGAVAASVRQVATVFFSDLLMSLIRSLLLPMVWVYVALSASNAIMPAGRLGGIAQGLQKAITWLLSGSLLLFTGYLSISGAFASSADSMTLRMTRSAIGGVIPVVGGIISDAADTVLAGAGVLKQSVGVLGTLTILATCILPFLKLGVQYLLLKLTVFFAATVAPEPLVKLVDALSTAFGLVLGMTGAAALLLLISVASSVMVVNV